jgi:hypothetical protein
VLDRVAAGLTNEERELGCRLTFIVERHLSNIYTKLGLGGKAARAAAAAALAHAQESHSLPRS